LQEKSAFSVRPGYINLSDFCVSLVCVPFFAHQFTRSFGFLAD
jgi:hypothetical protein